MKKLLLISLLALLLWSCGNEKETLKTEADTKITLYENGQIENIFYLIDYLNFFFIIIIIINIQIFVKKQIFQIPLRLAKLYGKKQIT